MITSFRDCYQRHPRLIDDFKVTHQRSPIVAGADFYPFGLPMEGREITQEDYRWGYQGQYAEKDTTTGWNQFQLRMYDARFGRWLSVDPYGQFWSPYVGMGNSPHLSIDMDGGFATDPIKGVKSMGMFRVTEVAHQLGHGIKLLDEIVVTGSRMIGLAERTMTIGKTMGLLGVYNMTAYEATSIYTEPMDYLKPEFRSTELRDFKFDFKIGVDPVIQPVPQNVLNQSLSTSFKADMLFSASVYAGRATIGTINRELARQNLINNMLQKSYHNRSTYSALKVPKALSFAKKLGGPVFGIWSGIETWSEYKQGSINRKQMVAEQIINGLSIHPSYGTAVSGGWYLGKKYGKEFGPRTWYGTDDTKYFK